MDQLLVRNQKPVPVIPGVSPKNPKAEFYEAERRKEFGE